MRSSSACTSFTTSTPSTTSDRKRGIRSATCSAGRPSDDVHRLAAKHRLHLLGEPSFGCQPSQELERVVGQAMLRVVEVETGRFGGHPLSARRIGVEQVPEMQRFDFAAMPLQPAPDGGLDERLSHRPAPGSTPRASCTRPRGIVVPEDRASRDQQVGAGLPRESDGLRVDASVDLDARFLRHEAPEFARSALPPPA